MPKPNLSAKEVLEGVCEYFEKELDGKRIKLPRVVQVEVSSSGELRAQHQEIIIVSVGGQEWILSIGVHFEPLYFGDLEEYCLVAIPAPKASTMKKKMTVICSELEESGIIDNLLIAKADGRLLITDEHTGVLWSRFRDEVTEALTSTLKKFVAEGDDTPGHISPRGESWWATRGTIVKYKPNFPHFLFACFVKIISDKS